MNFTMLLAACWLCLASSGRPQDVFDFGATAPTPGAADQSQLTSGFNNGGNYYVDGKSPGQTFTTGSNPLGYNLTGLYIKTSSSGAGGGQPGLSAYTLRVFSLTNATATAGYSVLLTTYVTTNSATFTQGDWFKFAGLTNVLQPNSAYGYSLNRNGSGYWRPDAASISFTGGLAARFATAAGTNALVQTYAGVAASFDARLVAITDPLVGDTTFAPANSVFAGTLVTLGATFSGTPPFTSFVWQSDGTSSGVTWTNLPGSTTNTYSINTTGIPAGTYQYRLIVTGGAGTITNAPGSLVVKNPSAPYIVVDTAISPSSTFAGNVVTMTATFDGSSPLAYQWQFSDLATFTNTIAGATNTAYTISDAAVANTGNYRLVATNSLGASNSAFAALTVTNSSVAVQILNLGATVPVSAGYDIAQLSTAGNQKFPSGGLNYYDDDGLGGLPGQTFTTGANGSGYLLTSVYIRWGDIEGGHVAANPFTLRIYSVAGTVATLIQTYTNQNSAAVMSVSQWTKWIGLSNVLAPNGTYAYSISARSETASSGAGYMQVGNADPNPYPGGALGLIPAAGGAINFGTSADDATFMVHLVDAPPSAPTVQSVNISPANSQTNPVYVGTPVTLSAVVIGSTPLHYQWQTDNGSGGASFGDISGATTSPYTLDTTGLTAPQTYEYQVIVTNSLGSATSPVANLYLTNGSGPVLLSGARVTPPVVIVGNNAQNNATVRAFFTGSLPITYQWRHAGTNIPGATSNSFTITGAQFTDAGTYTLIASNNPPGIGPTTAPSAGALLYVVPPAQTNTANAGMFDAGATNPIPGSYDVSQLNSSASTAVPGINYYVDNASPPGQIFKTLNSPPSLAGYPLNYVYLQHDSTGTGTGYSTAQTYTLRVYQMLDATNAQLLTSYVTTNTVTFPAGDWVLVSGLTNVLNTTASYAFSLGRNTSGYWKLAAYVSNPNPYPDGQAVVLPVLGGTAGVVVDPLANFWDAAFVAGLTPSSSSNPTMTFSVSGSTLSLSWPTDHAGWFAQSNSVNVATSAWNDIPGSQNGTSLSITVNRAQPTVYYRLRSP
jgi:hypothetical protein